MDIGGKKILRDYNSSTMRLLTTVYPEYDWLPWKFERVPHRFWENVENQRKFLDWASVQLNIKKLDDWYQIKTEV